MQNLCKNMLAMEAICPSGELLEGSGVTVAVRGMLDTMFKDRTDIDLSGADRHEKLVKISPSVRLADMSVAERLEGLGRAVGGRTGSKRARCARPVTRGTHVARHVAQD